MTVSGIVHVTPVWQKRLKDVLTDPLHALTFEGPGEDGVSWLRVWGTDQDGNGPFAASIVRWV